MTERPSINGFDQRGSLPVPDSRDPSKLMVSFAVPVYGCPQAIPALYDRIKKISSAECWDFELVLVDDCCPHGSWSAIKLLCESASSVMGIRLSRNFGQHAAIQAALAATSGDWVVVMDCDLQDRPEDVPALFAKAREGWNIVQARRGLRQGDRYWRRIASRLFYSALGFLTETDQDAEIANFGIYSRKVVDAILSWREDTKFFPAIVQWVGFSRTTVTVGHAPRHSASSSYTLKKLVRLAMNVVVGFSDRPLRLLVSFGLLMSISSFFVSFCILVLHFTGQIVVEGWASLTLSLWFIGGWLTFALGLTGTYVGRTLIETKGRPTFIADEVIRSSSTPDAVLMPFSIDRVNSR